MKYYWIFKYILYCATTKKNLVAAYHEGAAFALLLTTPIVLVSFIVDYWNMGVFLIICGILIAIDWTITWNDDKVDAKYHYLDLNKWKMEKEFNIVRWAIFIDISLFVFSLIFASVKEAGWI